MDIYDPTLPWVFNDRKDGSIAADIFIYIDDGRPLADTAWENWKSAGKCCCILNFFRSTRCLSEENRSFVSAW